MKKLIIILALTVFPFLSSFAEEAGLISPETGLNYDYLADLLAKKQWRRANDQTFDLLLQAANRETQGWLDVDSYRTIPCADLEIIDRLWREYSDGHFGFSIQLPIFLETGNKPGRLIDEANYESFGDRVGWRKDGDWIIFKENLIYNLDAPEGHLPNPRQEYELSGKRLEYTMFTQRMIDCELTSFK
jgi:hypothetical protein